MKHNRKTYITVYRMKWTPLEFRVAIAALNDRRLREKAQGLDCTKINRLLLKLIEAYEA